jgi:hypothetical protein
LPASSPRLPYPAPPSPVARKIPLARRQEFYIAFTNGAFFLLFFVNTISKFIPNPNPN